MKLPIGSTRLAALLWAVLCCTGFSSAAHAWLQSEDRVRVRSVPVAYSDLDLTHPADVQVLLGRIEKAAYRACGGNPRLHWTYATMPARTMAAFEECREDAVARAIGAVDAPALSQARAVLLTAKSCEASASC